MKVWLLVTGMLALLAAPGAAQAPRQGAVPQRTGWVVVEVVEHTDAAPIADAVVVLSALPPGSGRLRSTTLADGSARFDDVPPGRYTLGVTAAEHLPSPGASSALWPPPQTLTVEPNEASNVRLTLARSPAIQGVVFSPDGKPIRGAAVSVLAGHGARSIARVQGSGETITDADGRFRIGSLVPGSFRVRVSLDRTTPARYNYIYWPGSTLLAEAQSLELTYGDEPVLTIAAPAVPTVSLTGRVVDTGGQPVARADITLGAETIAEVSVQSAEDGTFIVPGLRRGSYHAVARISSGSVKGQVSHAAAGEIDVGATDVADVTLVVRPTSVMTGRFLFNGEQRPDPGRLAISAAPHGTDVKVRSTLVTTGGWHADGTFEVYGLLGRHVIGATGLPTGWRTEAILLEDGTDLLETPYDFADGRTHRNVRVLLTDQTATINVTVTGEQAEGPPVMAVAFPEDGTGWQGTSGVVQSARVLPGGPVALRGLAPGKVYLVALFRLTSPVVGVIVSRPMNETLLGPLTAAAVRVVVPTAGEFSVTLNRAAVIEVR